jgi:hypothetical protein
MSTEPRTRWNAPLAVRLRGALRQLRFPAEFRIAALPSPHDAIEQLVARLQAIPIPAEPPAGDVAERAAGETAHPDPAPLDDRAVADLATGLFRLRARMLEPGTDRPREEVRREYRHLLSVWDGLAEAGIQIQEHTGAPFDSGLSLRVVAFQPTPGASSRKSVSARTTSRRCCWSAVPRRWST